MDKQAGKTISIGLQMATKHTFCLRMHTRILEHYVKFHSVLISSNYAAGFFYIKPLRRDRQLNMKNQT